MITHLPIYSQIDNEREKYLRLKREHEIAKVKNEVALTTALRDVETTSREKETIKNSSESQMREVMESNQMKTKMFQRVQIQLRECEQRLKQRTSVEQELRMELEQVQKDRETIEGASMEAASQYEILLKVRISAIDGSLVFSYNHLYLYSLKLFL